MKNLLLLIGVVALAFGLLFAAQGLGYIDWPSSSFMIRDMKWAYYGGVIAAVGLALIVASRRR
jgi:hypothetical protein